MTQFTRIHAKRTEDDELVFGDRYISDTACRFYLSKRNRRRHLNHWRIT